jgi:hypothetical protein
MGPLERSVQEWIRLVQLNLELFIGAVDDESRKDKGVQHYSYQKQNR